MDRVDRDCYRCHGTGDDPKDGSLCPGCSGQGTVCRLHSNPDCPDCHAT